MSLREYHRKRNFRKTAEPAGKVERGARHRFVIQKHDATRLHYDLRLELRGTFKSWAVPKGLPYAHGEKHLAVQVEDHPLAYADFEGTIPAGEYGGGTVMVWDRGTYTPLSRTPAKDLENGKLHFVLEGDKLQGEWYLVRLKKGDGKEWLVIRGGDSLRPPGKKKEDTSVLSGLSMKKLAAGDRVWSSESKHHAAALPEFVEPMKAKLVAAPPQGDWIYEIKFDGWRALALKGGSQARLLSRNEKDFGGKFPEIMEAVTKLSAQDAILDGEIVALDDEGRSSFQLLQAFDIGDARPPLYYYVFDLLQLNGEDLRALPVEERKERLARLLKKSPPIIRLSDSLGGDAEHLLDQVRDLGLEGLIGKMAHSTYETGRRSGAWIKLKIHNEQEFVVGGYTDPEGSRLHFGALLIGVYKGGKLQCVGRVGTGFSGKLLRSLHSRMKKQAIGECPFANLPMSSRGKWGQGITKADMRRCHWIEPTLVAQIKFSEWTRDGRLRQPVFLGLREDKPAAQVKRERTR